MVLHRQVQDHIENLVTEHFSGDVEAVLRDPILFGDFRMALREDEARIYEDIQDYEAAKALFQVCTLTSSGSRSESLCLWLWVLNVGLCPVQSCGAWE